MRPILVLFSFIISMSACHAVLYETVNDFKKYISGKQFSGSFGQPSKGSTANMTPLECNEIAQHINGQHFELKNFGPDHSKTRSHTSLILDSLALLSVATYEKNIDKSGILNTLYSPATNAKGYSQSKEYSIKVHRGILGFLFERTSYPFQETKTPQGDFVSTRLKDYLDLTKDQTIQTQKKILDKYGKEFNDKFTTLTFIDVMNGKNKGASVLAQAFQIHKGLGHVKSDDNAANTLEDFIKKDQTHPKAWYLLGKIYWSLEETRKKRAYSLFKKALLLGSIEAGAECDYINLNYDRSYQSMSLDWLPFMTPTPPMILPWAGRPTGTGMPSLHGLPWTTKHSESSTYRPLPGGYSQSAESSTTRTHSGSGVNITWTSSSYYTSSRKGG